MTHLLEWLTFLCAGAIPGQPSEAEGGVGGQSRGQKLKEKLKPSSFTLPFVPAARPAAPERYDAELFGNTATRRTAFSYFMEHLMANCREHVDLHSAA